jgi:hypothetical protein
MKVPQGDHEIRFKFQPRSYSIGEQISLICSLLIVLILGFGVWQWMTTAVPLTPVAISDQGTTHRHGPKEKKLLKPKKKHKP